MGALVSAVSLAARKAVVALSRMIQISAALFGVGSFSSASRIRSGRLCC